MKLVIYVMEKTELLDEFLYQLNKKGIRGATILNSTGMAKKLSNSDDMRFIGSLRMVLEKPKKESYVILIAVPKEEVQTVFSVINEVSGSLSEPNSGIALTLSIDEIKGCYDK